MAYVAVNKDGEEKIFERKPERGVTTLSKIHLWTYDLGFDSVPLPKGTIKKLIGRTLTWQDEPVELGVKKQTELKGIERCGKCKHFKSEPSFSGRKRCICEIDERVFVNSRMKLCDKGEIINK